jgi:hypothetical protein
MTAGMTTQKLDRRVTLPRAGLGALLAATLLAGGLIGAAAYAGIGAATAQPASVSATLQHEWIVVRNLRISAGRGQLVGDDPATVTGGNTTNVPAHDGFRYDRAPGQITHAPGRGR